MSIPKIIHYCWFGGGQIPLEYISYIDNWKRILPDYEFIRWDESNCDIHINAFVEKAYKARKWAFISDYFRLKALYEYGGIYLDTDVEVQKSFDELLQYKAFVGYIWDCLIGTAVIGAEKESEMIRELLLWYEHKEDFELIPNNHLLTDYFIKQPWFRLDGRTLIHENVAVFCKETFEIPPLFGKGYSIHHIANSWHDEKKVNTVKKLLKRIIPYRVWRQLGAYKALKMNDYYLEYRKVRREHGNDYDK